MAPARTRLAAVLGGVLVTLAAAGGGSAADPSQGRSAHGYARSLDGQSGAGELRADRLARLAVTWRGGPIVTSTGETVTVLVSDSLPLETPEKWAEFLVHLTHGPELTALETTIATLDEVQDVCGPDALGCYSRNRMIALGAPTIDGTTPEEVVRHEYGHHLANHRQNTPWPALDWGPKQWASAASVCLRVSRREAFPGDGGRNYAQNPGEAWAEVYRVMDERKAGITTATWDIVSRTFFPGEPALAAAERDVLQPWAKNRTTSYRRTFGKRTKVWWIPLRTPLDGELVLQARVSKKGLFGVALVAPDRKTVLRRANWVGQRLKRTRTNVCGQRTMFVRVTRNGPPGSVKVTVSAP
jgi:hypothetical protein